MNEAAVLICNENRDCIFTSAGRAGSDFPVSIDNGHHSEILIEYDVFIVRCWTHACKIFVL